MKVLSLLAQVALVQSTLCLAGYTNESEVPYYGRSPAVYPSPIGNGSTNTAWEEAYQRAKTLVSKLTVEEKTNLTRGHDGQCVGNSGAVPRLSIPSLCFSDAPDGVRGQEFVSAFPAGIHVASTWDRSLLYQYGYALGEEYHDKGVNVALGPVAGPLGRLARGGRNWEGLGADPYLAGVGMGAITKGIQEAGVIANAKHWLLNEEEWRRNPGDMGEALSSNVDDRTLHELYAFPFMDSLKEGIRSVMCSYQRSNHSYGCQNSKLLNGVLKTELGFEGFVVSDWEAQHAGVASANAGLDIVMPDGGFWGRNLTRAVNNGSVTADRLDDMVTRILAAWYLTGQDEGFPAPGIYSEAEKHDPIDVQRDHADLIQEIGSAGTVLVKNVNSTLPFTNSTRFLSVYGYDATVSASPWANPSRYGGGYEVNFGWTTFNGTLFTGGGSGGSTPPYVVSPFQALQERTARNRGTLRWDFYSENPTPAYVNSDACLVFINAYASEAFDRTSLTDEFSDNLVKNVATNCSNTIVVIHSAGIRTVDAWINHPNVTAVLYAGLPGQESGHSLADILYGGVNPSGRLPYTVAKNESDYGSLLNSTISFDAFPEVNFTEGLYIDYRAFDRKEITPRFEFGFGLSYTTFKYSDLHVKSTGNSTSALVDPSIAVVQGGHPELWDTLFEVTASITNTGDVAGSEVAQLYVEIPNAPVRQLRGFDRVPLKAGETKKVTFPLTRRDLSIWDVVAQQWRLQAAEYNVFVGASSRILHLNGTLQVE
ncbi:beta-glucosidase [Aspergillus affinis]|uniref:beta-glucosidase n=1 Tax=Aspergillus affinis TaxID=1070780 RepID=UPI0022FE870F|nr:beta-glucosidase-related glycosidase [Aspergillus affinis]KAI9038862.1 beta-glucosidase-related glycosidase [Aspergillus affinis]